MAGALIQGGHRGVHRYIVGLRTDLTPSIRQHRGSVPAVPRLRSARGPDGRDYRLRIFRCGGEEGGMERALNLNLLAEALGGQQGLPTPEELQRRLGDAEVQLFRRQTSIPDDLLETAWYLHAIASVDQAQQLYTIPRQRQAFAVSAHVFDMALAD